MNGKENTYYIGQLAKELGLSQRTIRYYEELGFINPRRTEGGFRTYSGRDADILRMVIRFKDLGMRLDDIRSLLLTSETTLTSKVMTQLVEALQTRRCDFESKMKECTESIEQIDKVLKFLSKCATCGKPSVEGICERCIRDREEHGEKVTPIISSLLGNE